MKKYFPIVAVICSIFFFLGCVISKNLIVLNSSDEEIEIQYELKGLTYFQAKIINESDLNSWSPFKKDFEEIPANRYSLNEMNKIVTVKVKPHEAVEIENEDLHYLRLEHSERFNLKNLKIKGKNKEIYFENS